jgi:hypothetical protein
MNLYNIILLNCHDLLNVIKTPLGIEGVCISTDLTNVGKKESFYQSTKSVMS